MPDRRPLRDIGAATALRNFSRGVHAVVEFKIPPDDAISGFQSQITQ